LRKHWFVFHNKTVMMILRCAKEQFYVIIHRQADGEIKNRIKKFYQSTVNNVHVQYIAYCKTMSMMSCLFLEDS
jgi:hypothetical protein